MKAKEATSIIGLDGARLLELAELNLELPVPTYRGWLLGNLVAHVGSVHRWVTGIVRFGIRQPSKREPPMELAANALRDWYQRGLDELVAALDHSDQDAPVWTLGGEGRVSFWMHRMAHETAVHRWDAELAHGSPTPFPPALALDGIPETLEIHVVSPLRGRVVGNGRGFVLACTDAPDEWTIRCGLDGVQVERGRLTDRAEICGQASDVWLYIMARPAEGLSREGDLSAFASFERAIRTIPPPAY